nr:hypothetical protein CFP56_20503 [Quercus suber]
MGQVMNLRVGECEEDAGNRDHLKERGGNSKATGSNLNQPVYQKNPLGSHIPGVSTLPLLDVLFFLSLRHAFELEVSRMCVGSILPALQNHKRHRAHDGNEVQRQIHDVSHQSLWREFGKRLRDQLSQTSNGITRRATFHLALLLHEHGLTLCDQGTVECINQAILNEKRFREHHGQRAALAKNEQDRRERRQRTRREHQHSNLWQVSEQEHDGRDARSKSERWRELREKRLVKILVRGKVIDALDWSFSAIRNHQE